MQPSTLPRCVCSTAGPSYTLSLPSNHISGVATALRVSLCSTAWSGQHTNARRLRGAFTAAPRCRSVTSNTQKGGAAFSDDRQRWFERQLRAHTLIPVDLIPLAQRQPVPRSPVEMKRGVASREKPSDSGADAMTDAFLSCCLSPLCDPALLLSVFAQLGADQKAAVLCAAFTRGLHGRLSCLTACVEAALSSHGFAAAHWVRVLRCVRGVDPTYPLSVVAVMRRVLGDASDASLGSAEDVRQFVAVALQLLEAQQTPSSAVVECLEACGLAYEACAYAPSPPGTPFRPFPFPSTMADTDGRGYGALLHAICALPRPPLKWFATVRQTMPPVLQRHATLMLLHSAVRRCGGLTSDESATWGLLTAELLTPLEAASDLHFLLGEGNALTAGLLLEHSHTEQQLLTLLRYTHGVPHRLAFDALERLLQTRRGGRVVVHLRMASRRRRTSVALQCEAQLGGCPLTTAAAPVGAAPCSADDAEALAQPLSVASLDRGHVQQYLRDALPRGFVARGERSLAQMLAAIPPGTVDHVAQSLPTMHGDALSWWVALYLRGGNVEGAFAVLRVVAGRGCLPHMAVLVELLEHTQDDTASFVRAVAVVRQDFPTAAETVLRAFVERTASRMSAAAASPQLTAQAVQTLRALAVMGLPRLSVRVLGDMAVSGAADTIGAILELAEQLCGARVSATDVVALDVAAIRGLVAAGAALHYRVGVSVLSVTEDGALGGWWGTAARPRRSLSSFAYATQDLPLWPWVRAEALADGARLTHGDLHRAVRLVALGSRDATAAVALWRALRERLREGHEGQPRVHRAARRRSPDSEAHTLACVAAACIAQGKYQLASQVLHSACNGEEMPPLLKALLLTPRASQLEKDAPHRRGVELGAAPRELPAVLPRQLRRLVAAAGSEILVVFARSGAPAATPGNGKQRSVSRR